MLATENQLCLCAIEHVSSLNMISVKMAHRYLLSCARCFAAEWHGQTHCEELQPWSFSPACCGVGFSWETLMVQWLSLCKYSIIFIFNIIYIDYIYIYIYLSIHVSIYPIHLSVHPSIHLPCPSILSIYPIHLSYPSILSTYPIHLSCPSILSIYPSIHLSYPCILSIYPPILPTYPIHRSIYPIFHLSTYPPFHLSIYPSILLSIYPPIHLSVYPSIYPSSRLSTYPSIHLSTYLKERDIYGNYLHLNFKYTNRYFSCFWVNGPKKSCNAFPRKSRKTPVQSGHVSWYLKR